MALLLTLFIMGCFLGFVGAGGAGVVIAALTTFFDIPIHVALGTSLTAMAFTTLSGAYSHFQERNVVLRPALAVGFFGIFGAFTGAKISASIPAARMHWLTGGLLYLTAILIYIKVFHPDCWLFGRANPVRLTEGRRFWLTACLTGIGNGLISGIFGVGATPFIQLSLMQFFGLDMIEAVGSTMLVILPIAVMGGLGYMTSGLLDFHLLLQVVIGLMVGAYIGAKFTKRANRLFLKIAMVVIPTIGATLLIFR